MSDDIIEHIGRLTPTLHVALFVDLCVVIGVSVQWNLYGGERGGESHRDGPGWRRLSRVSLASSWKQLHLVSEVKEVWVVAEGGGGLEWWSRRNDTLWMWGRSGGAL
jgi:hypothetical protein